MMPAMLHFSSKSLKREHTPPSRIPAEDLDSVRPFGPSGVGLITGHPVGIVIVIGVILMAIFGIPGAFPFFAGAVALGGVIGLVLWLYNRNRGF
jgi:hypothetical protein